MVFTEERNGKTFVVCSKFWPDGKRFRRRCPNKTVANQLLARIAAAIALGNWRELREELDGKKKVARGVTVAEYADIYLEDYCNKRNTRPDFKRETLKVIKKIVGHVRIQNFTRTDALHFEKVRARSVAPATVNRGLAVLSHMLTFAFKQGVIESHPMLLYGRLPEKQRERRYLTLNEARALIGSVFAQDPVVGAYVGILAETGLRMEEGLGLKWSHVDIPNKNLTVPASKNQKIRHVPLSDYALELVHSLPRFIGKAWLFCRLSTGEQLRAPRREWEAGKRALGLSWVRGLHDLRHFRASQWILGGVDPLTVKELLGHRDINTTMIYAHFNPKHAHKAVLAIQNTEAVTA